MDQYVLALKIFIEKIINLDPSASKTVSCQMRWKINQNSC